MCGSLVLILRMLEGAIYTNGRLLDNRKYVMMCTSGKPSGCTDQHLIFNVVSGKQSISRVVVSGKERRQDTKITKKVEIGYMAVSYIWGCSSMVERLKGEVL